MQLHKLAFAWLIITGAAPAQAALLRPYAVVAGETVRLGDLFDQLGATPDRALGKAPLPGARISVGAAQLAAIARDFNVDWRPVTGSEQAVIERRADMLPQSIIAAVIRQALADKGAPDNADIAMPDAQPFLVPAGAHPKPEASQCNYDPESGRFTALLTLFVEGSAPSQQRVSGAVVPMVYTAIATHRLSPGSAIGAEDVAIARVPRRKLRGAQPLTETTTMGLTVKHDVLAGQPLTTADLTRPDLVTRGSSVLMRLSASGITLSAQGIARDSGAMGDHIRVENPVSHAMVQAIITGPEEVGVDPLRAPLTLANAR